MPFGEMLEEAGPPRRILRVNQVVPDWVPGEHYETPNGDVKFILLEMDVAGMTLDIISFDLGETNKKEDREDRPMQVVPSPS